MLQNTDEEISVRIKLSLITGFTVVPLNKMGKN